MKRSSNKNTIKVSKQFFISLFTMACLFLLSNEVSFLFSQDKSVKSVSDSDDQLIEQYIKAKGHSIITFDSSNIKQFWVDPSVISRDNSFEIILSRSNNTFFESRPLSLQLINVLETLDCKIDVLTENKDVTFAVANSEMKTISNSETNDLFLNYNIVSSVFHLEETKSFSFKLIFKSKTETSISVKKVILSFSKNDNSTYLASPGNVIISDTNTKCVDRDKDLKPISINNGCFSVTGVLSRIFSTKKIIVDDNAISNSVTIKNIGDNPVKVYIGYAPYTRDGLNITNRNNLYKNSNKILNVVSFESQSNRITVDSYPEWVKGCFLVLNAKEDFSDFPNFSFVNSKIAEVKQLENGHAEIFFEKPINIDIPFGSSVRIQSGDGNTYIYTNQDVLQPGEEKTFTSSIKKDNSLLEYSNKAFPKGTYYVVPAILSFSVDRNKDNTIQISNYSVSY